MMKLSGSRIVLHPLKKNDQRELWELFNDPFIGKYLWDDRPVSHEEVREILKKNDKYFRELSWGLWKILLHAKLPPIGFVGLWPFFDENQPQLIYGLLPVHTGSGLGTEATKIICQYVQYKLQWSYLDASINKPNKDSQELARRLGMQFLKEDIIEGKETLFYRLTFK